MQSWPSIEWNDKMLKIPTWNSKISRKPHCNCKVSTKALNIGIPIHIGVASGLSKYLNCKCSPFLPTSLCRMRLRLALKLGCQQHNTVLQPSDKRAKSSGEKKQLYYRQICLRKISRYTSLKHHEVQLRKSKDTFLKKARSMSWKLFYISRYLLVWNPRKAPIFWQKYENQSNLTHQQRLKFSLHM